MTRKVWGAMVVIGLVGCGDPLSNCVVPVDGVDVCIPDQTSMSFCRDVWGGEAFESDSSDDPSCKALGYGVECEGILTNTGEATLEMNYYFAETAEDCAAVDGATFADLE